MQDQNTGTKLDLILTGIAETERITGTKPFRVILHPSALLIVQTEMIANDVDSNILEGIELLKDSTLGIDDFYIQH